MISLGTVNISQTTKRLLHEVLRNGMIGQGEYISQFEEKLAKFLGLKYVVATANGTFADAVALAAIKNIDGGKRNEVIVPALTFIAHINSLYYNHLKPVFIDVGYDYQINVDEIGKKINKNTLAIMPAHLLGRPAEMDKIEKLAKYYNLYVVEDACEALGSQYKNRLCGTIGDMGCFSFFVSHSITTGEGGAIVTNSKKLAELARALRNHGRKGTKPGEHFIFSNIGFSARMNSLEAIVGLGVIDDLGRHIEKRHDNLEKLNKIIGKDLFFEGKGEYIVPHGYPMLVSTSAKRNKLLRELPEKYGIEARQIFYSIPTQCAAYKFLGEKLGSYPVAEDIGRRGIYVPCHQNLSTQELEKIGKILKSIL